MFQANLNHIVTRLSLAEGNCDALQKSHERGLLLSGLNSL